MSAEYICKTASANEWQKWLNQWRHGYEIQILSMTSTDNTITILLRREEKTSKCIR